MEQVDTTTSYTVERLDLQWRARHIAISLVSTRGEAFTVTYDGTIAETMMRALNTADLTVKSLHRRIIERLIADGRIAGSITGTPDP